VTSGLDRWEDDGGRPEALPIEVYLVTPRHGALRVGSFLTLAAAFLAVTEAAERSTTAMDRARELVLEMPTQTADHFLSKGGWRDEKSNANPRAPIPIRIRRRFR
jgi:hypothetical protein